MSADTVLLTWSERLAARVAPDEIDIAPDVAAAYAAGGSRRTELFAGARNDPGAVALPAVLQSLDLCATTVCDFLARDAVNTGVTTAGLLVALRQLQRSRPPAAPPGADEVPPEVVERAEDSIADLRARLRESVATAERAEAIAGLVLAELARDPAGARAFLGLVRGQRR